MVGDVVRPDPAEWLARNRTLPGRITVDGSRGLWFLGRWTLPPGRRTWDGCPDDSCGPLTAGEAARALAGAGLPIPPYLADAPHVV